MVRCLNTIEQFASELLKQIGYIVKPFNDKSIIDPKNTIYSQASVPGIDRVSFDFVLWSCHIAIEIDGSYWHGKSANLNARQAVRRLLDDEKDRMLWRQGWRILRIVDRNITPALLQSRIFALLDTEL